MPAFSHMWDMKPKAANEQDKQELKQFGGCLGRGRGSNTW